MATALRLSHVLMGIAAFSLVLGGASAGYEALRDPREHYTVHSYWWANEWRSIYDKQPVPKDSWKDKFVHSALIVQATDGQR